MTDEAYRQHEEARCKVKQRFRSAQAATGAARFKEVRTGFPLFIYRCPCCGGWHLTKNDKKAYDLAAFERGLHQAKDAGLISEAEMREAVKAFKRGQG